MSKRILLKGDAREALVRGINQLANTVKPTLGPRGRNVILQRKVGPNFVCSDGVTIAREIDLFSVTDDTGAQLLKEAAIQTNIEAGDGTTTSIVLAQKMINEGQKRIVAGSDSSLIVSGMKKAALDIVSELKKMSVPVQTSKQIQHIATLASHEQELGMLVADAVNRAGRTGIITVDETKKDMCELEYIEGAQLNRGYISPIFINDPEKSRVVLEKPLILITDQTMSSIFDVLPVVEKSLPVSKQLLIIAEDVVGDALHLLTFNVSKTKAITCAVIRAPDYGDRKRDMLEDLAILTGATVISPERGKDFKHIVLSDLGQADRVIVTRESTVILHGKGDISSIDSRINSVRHQLSSKEVSGFDKLALEERLAKLTNRVVIIKVGAISDSELKTRKEQVDDALAATKSAIEEGIVAGGGVALIRAALRAKMGKQELSNDELTGFNLVHDAIQEPLRAMLQNAGFRQDKIIDMILSFESDSCGFDIEENRIGNMLDFGIIDSTKSIRCALENAVSVASMVLSSSVVVVENKRIRKYEGT